LEVAATSSSGAQAGLLRTLDPEGAPLTQVDQSGKGWSFSRDLGTRELLGAQEIGGGSASVATGYDLAGLRSSHSDLLASGAWSTNSAGETSQARGRPVVNDLLGRVTSLDGWNHTYSCDGLLLSSEPASPSEGSRRSAHAYDALGRRVRTTVEAYVGGQWTAFSATERDFLGRLPLGIETSFADGSSKSWRFLRGPDASGTLEGAGGARGVLAVLKDASSWKAVAADTLGNVLALAGTSGDFTRRTFDPWGNPLTRDAAGNLRASTLQERRADYDALPLAWASQEVDPDTGLTHYHFREYSPSLGGWLTQDPIGLAGGYLNLRSYLGNRPADALDAWGRSMWSGWWGVPTPNQLDDSDREYLKENGWDHTKVTLTFTIEGGECCDPNKLAREIREQIQRFEHWDAPRKNETDLRIKTDEKSGSRHAFFDMRGKYNTARASVASVLTAADKVQVVKLDNDPDGPGGSAALQATTMNDHLLKGARRWGVDVNGKTITIWTESYDIAQGFVHIRPLGFNFNWRPVNSSLTVNREEVMNKGGLGEADQYKLWTTYLDNLYQTAKSTHGKDPSRKNCALGKPEIVSTFGRTSGQNPWRSDLR